MTALVITSRAFMAPALCLQVQEFEQRDQSWAETTQDAQELGPRSFAGWPILRPRRLSHGRYPLNRSPAQDTIALPRASCFWVYAYPALLRYAAHSAGGYWARILPQASEIAW